MDENKEKNTIKRINIKNKKDATKALSKSSSTKSKKNTPKKNKPKQGTTTKVATKKETEVSSVKKVKAKEVKDKQASKEKKVKSQKQKNKKTTEKAKIVIPKEWQNINKTQKTKQVSDEKLSGKLKSSIFEEVDEKTFQIQKKKQKETLKKTFLITLIILSIGALSIYLLFKYNDYVKKQFKVYDKYSIGDKVSLKDESIWYVVEDSNNSMESVKLISENVIDSNEDGKQDYKDKKMYNTQNTDVFDKKDENSIAFYLEEEYRPKLEESIGEIKDITLLTSKEYIKIRERMGFGYEWSTGNWLANSKLDKWWIISSQNEKVYIVIPTGTYRLVKSNSINYVRPVITIDKELVTIIKENNSNEENFFSKLADSLLVEKKDNKD